MSYTPNVDVSAFCKGPLDVYKRQMQPILYSIIEKRKLRELLETFYECIGLPVQVLDETGEILDAFGEDVYKRQLLRSGCNKVS